MSTPTNIPETPMGETEQDSFFESKEKLQQQLQHIFQTTLRLTAPDQFDQLCQWMEYKQYLTIEDFYNRPYELHDDFLATLTRERYLKFRHMDNLYFSASSPSHHEPYKHQVKKGPQRKDSSLNKKKSVMMMNMPMRKSNFPLIQNQRNILHIQFISHHFTPRCHKSLSYLPTSRKHFLRAPNR